MRLSRGRQGIQIRFSRNEFRALLDLLCLYPRIPPAHHKLTRGTAVVPDAQSSQALLDEALAEHREETRREILQLLKRPDTLKPDDRGGMTLRLRHTDVEGLLQVLNDLRVGSWLELGSPEDLAAPPEKSKAEDYWVMETAGAFQSLILECLNRGND